MLFFILTAVNKFMTAFKPLLNSDVLLFAHLGVPVAVALPKIFQYILFGVLFPNAAKMQFFNYVLLIAKKRGELPDRRLQ